jgi:hypothetical protein
MENSKKVISEGNFVVYIWFWGGLITSFVSNWLGDFLKAMLPSDGVLFLVLIYIFDVVILYLVVKYMISWIEARYELSNKKKLLKSTFNIFLAWSLVGIVIAFLGLTATDKSNYPLIISFIIGYILQLVALHFVLNRYLKIKYF